MSRTISEVLAELEQFNHKSAVRILRQHLNIVCSCSNLSNFTEHRCELHPDMRATTFDARMDFEQAFDRRIEAVEASK